MLAMILTDEKNPWAIDLKEGRELELRLGISSKGKIWKNISDVLIAFYTSSPASVNRLIVTTEQLNFLKALLLKPSVDSCREL
jgi:hypothetical protein